MMQIRWWLLAVVCARGVFFMLSAPRPAGERRGPQRLLTALTVMALASALWSDAPRFSFALAASFAVGMVLTFGILWRLLDQEDVTETFARAVTVLALIVFGSGFLVAGLSFLFKIWPFFNATGIASDRYSGIFRNPNMAGILGAMLLPIVLATPARYLGRAARIRPLTVALIAATIFMSGSRSAFLGAVFAVVVLALYRFGAGGFVTMSLGMAAVVVLATVAPVENIDESVVGHITRTDKLWSLSGRIELWEEGWEAAQGHLFIGNGWGMNRSIDSSVDLDRALERGGVQYGTNLHNAHLQLLVDLGFVGVGLFWAFCGIVLRGGWGLMTGKRTPRTALTLVLFASVVAMLADTWVHGWIFSTGSPATLVFWGFCAMILKEVDRARRTGEAAPAFAAEPLLAQPPWPPPGAPVAAGGP